jgi:hypothetical protein
LHEQSEAAGRMPTAGKGTDEAAGQSSRRPSCRNEALARQAVCHADDAGSARLHPSARDRRWQRKKSLLAPGRCLRAGGGIHPYSGKAVWPGARVILEETDGQGVHRDRDPAAERDRGIPGEPVLQLQRGSCDYADDGKSRLLHRSQSAGTGVALGTAGAAGTGSRRCGCAGCLRGGRGAAVMGTEQKRR